MSNILYDELTLLYHPNLFEYKSVGGIVTINEHEQNAMVKFAEMCYHGKLLSIKNDLLKDCHKIYKENESNSPELKHDCDGIFFLTCQEKKYFILIELKSKYNKTNLEKAEKQLAASYIRVLSRLSCLKDFDINRYKVCGIIVSQGPTTAERTKADKKRKTKQRLDRYEKQMMTFCKGDTPFELNHQFVHTQQLPIREDLLFDKLPIFHIDCNGSSVRFELAPILNKLE